MSRLVENICIAGIVAVIIGMGFLEYSITKNENREFCQSHDMTYVGGGDCVSSDGTVYGIGIQKKRILVPASK